jgi:hypothetical protein
MMENLLLERVFVMSYQYSNYEYELKQYNFNLKCINCGSTIDWSDYLMGMQENFKIK